MKKLFISQPMNGLSDEEILKERKRIEKAAEEKLGEPVETMATFFDDYPPNAANSVGLWYLSQSLSFLALADVAYFGKGWNEARGCKIEHECAVAYGIEYIEE